MGKYMILYSLIERVYLCIDAQQFLDIQNQTEPKPSVLLREKRKNLDQPIHDLIGTLFVMLMLYREAVWRERE